MLTLLLVLGALCLLAAAHPFTTYPLSLLAIRRILPPPRHALQRPGTRLDFAICMCAYNEERVIEAKVQNLLALRAREPGLQILVYVDAATDRTAEILRRHADSMELVVATQRRGKTYGMNLLAARARASVLVFTDATVMLDLNCLDDLRRWFSDPDIGCVCGNLSYTNAGSSVTAASGAFYWRFEQALKRLESDLGSTMGADGSIFAMRRFLRRAPPDHIIDDMYVSLMALCDGFRVVQADDVRGYEESVPDAGEEFNRKVRIACQAFNVHRLLWPRLRKLGFFVQYQYVSHKLLRWLSIYFLAGAGVAFFGAAWVAGSLGVALAALAACALTLALGARWLKPVKQALDLLVALSGAGFGVWRSLLGERYQTWTPAGSIRRRSAP